MVASGFGADDKLPTSGGTMTGNLTLEGTPPLTIPAGASSGDVLTSDSAGNASWEAPAGGSGLGGVTVSGTPSSGQMLTATSSSAADWQNPAAVTVIDGVTVSGTPSTGQVLTATSASAADWQGVTATTLDGVTVTGTPSAGQVITATSASAANWQGVTATTLDGVTVTGIPASGQVLTATSSTAADWQAPSGGSGIPYSITSSPYSAVAAKVVSDGAMTASSTTLTCSTSAPFTSGSAGDLIVVAGAGVSGGNLITTIASYSSASQVVLAAAAATTVTSAQVTFGADSTTHIQSALTAVFSAGGAAMYIPAGTYLTTASLTGTNVGSGVTVYGDGNASVVMPTGSYDTLVIGTGTGITIRDLQVSGAVSVPTAGSAIRINSVADYRIDNVSAYGCYYGLYTTGGTSKTANTTNCFFDAYYAGFYSEGSFAVIGSRFGGGIYGAIMNSSGGHSARMVRTGLYGPLPLTTQNTGGGVKPNETVWLTDVECNYQTGNGTPAEGTGGMNLDWCAGDIHITACWLAGSGLTIGGNVAPTWVDITGGIFSGNTPTLQNGIHLKAGREITITGAHLTGSANHALYDDILIESAVAGPVSITGCEFSGSGFYNINSAATAGPFSFVGNTCSGYSSPAPINYPGGSAAQYTIVNSGPVNLLPGSLTVAQVGSNLAGGGMISQGSGAPSAPNGNAPAAGDIYFRTDTPSTSGQRLYCCTAGGSSPTWVGLI